MRSFRPPHQIFLIYNAKMSSQKHRRGQRRMNTLEIEEHSENNSKLHDKIYEQFLPFPIEEELELNLQKYSRQIKEEIRFILLDLLRYPSSDLAQRHRNSNRLGNFDLKQIKNKNTSELQYNHSSHLPQVCADCGLPVQQGSIPLCSSVWQYPKAGVSVYYLFENVKMLAAQLFVLGLFFAILALYTSIIQPTDQFSLENFPAKLSYSAKMKYASTNQVLALVLAIQAWAVVFSVIIWWFLQFAAQSTQQKYVRMVDQEYLSASDFTVMLEDVPVGFTKERLQNEFNVYFQSLVYQHNLKKNWGQSLLPFEIERVTQVHPFGLSESDIMDQQLQGLDRDIVEKRKLLALWVREFKENSRFTFQKQDRRREYDNLERMLERRRIKILKMEVKAREQYRLPTDKNLKTTFFVTFKFNQSAHIIEDLNPQSIPAKIRYLVSCCRTAQYLTVRDNSNQTITIPVSRAPDPEDLIWGNLKVPLLTRFLWKLLTWGVIILFLGITFGICYGFNKLGIQSQFSYTQLILSVILTLLNMAMKFAIRQLSHFERDETESDRQRGILIKCLIALPANWLITPLILSIPVNKDFYGASGIVYFVFFLSLTNAFLPPLLRFFDPTSLFRMVRFCWNNRPYKKMELRQSELNELCENQDYEIGWVYIYFIELFYFTCIFASMVPFVIPIALLGFLLMFWVEKHCLLRRSSRPAKKSKALLTTAQTAIHLGPLILGFFGFIWVCIPREDYSSLAFIGYTTLIGVGALYFITPFRAIFKCLFPIPQEEVMTYEQARQRIGSQYEQLNPLTSEIGRSELEVLQIRKREEERLTTLNRSEDNLLEHMQMNQIIEGLTKIPNIFGRNKEISRKIDRNDLVLKSRVRKETEEVIFVNPPRNDTIEKELFDSEEIAKNEDQMSRAMTQQKPVVNYSSSGNAYARRNQVERRKAISVMREGAYDAVVETQSQSK